jgi:hypothetical protein
LITEKNYEYSRKCKSLIFGCSRTSRREWISNRKKCEI